MIRRSLFLVFLLSFILPKALAQESTSGYSSVTAQRILFDRRVESSEPVETARYLLTESESNGEIYRLETLSRGKTGLLKSGRNEHSGHVVALSELKKQTMIVGTKRRGETDFKFLTLRNLSASSLSEILRTIEMRVDAQKSHTPQSREHKTYDTLAREIVESHKAATEFFGHQAKILEGVAAKQAARNQELHEVSIAKVADSANGATILESSVKAEIESATALMKDRMAFRTYDYSADRLLETAVKAEGLAQSYQFSRAVEALEPVIYASDGSSPALSFVNEEGIAEFEKLDRTIPTSPLSAYSFATNLKSPEGQLVRRAGNAYQAYWAQTDGLKRVTRTQKFAFVDGLLLLAAADRAFALGRTQEGGSYLSGAWEFLIGVREGFTDGTIESLQSVFKDIPAVLGALGGLKNRLVDVIGHPDEAVTALTEFALRIPGVVDRLWHQTTLSLKQLRNASPYEQGVVVGRAFGFAVGNVVTDGAWVFVKSTVSGAKALRAAKAVTEVLDTVENGYIAEKVGAAALARVAKEKEFWLAALGKAERPGTRDLLERLIQQDAYLRTSVGAVTDLAKAGWRLNEKKLIEISRRAEKINAAMKAIPGKAESTVVFRGLLKSHVESGMQQGLSRAEAVFARHPSQVTSVGRFTVGGAGGVSGLYVANSVKTAAAELGKEAKNAVFESRRFHLKKVLDLTDPEVRSRLDINSTQFIQRLENKIDAYELTQTIGYMAKEAGFDAIKFSSSKNNNGTNWIIF